MAKKFIFVTLQKEGVHFYPEAKNDPKLATGDWDDVSFLGLPHRHIFHFKVWIEVYHDNRELEFIQVKRFINRLYEGGTLDADSKSCEMLADELYKKLAEKFGSSREIRIEISEDNENGCYIEY